MGDKHLNVFLSYISSFSLILLRWGIRTGYMIQWLRVFEVSALISGLVSGTHTVAHNCLQLHFWGFGCQFLNLLDDACIGYIYITYMLVNTHEHKLRSSKSSLKHSFLVFIYSSIIFYIPTAVLLSSSPPSLSSITSPFSTIQSSSFPFRKGHTSQGYQPNMTCQIIIMLGTCPHIKA